MTSPVLTPQSSYEARTNFVVELSTRLHAYGTTAQRLEGAIEGVAHRLGLDCEIWSNPTGIILSFADPVRGPQNGITRVLRLEPGDQTCWRGAWIRPTAWPRSRRSIARPAAAAGRWRR